MTIRIDTIHLGSHCFLLLDLVAGFLSKFKVDQILEKLNHVMILLQKTFATTKRANRLWVIYNMVA
jgi:hypothetical protein